MKNVMREYLKILYENVEKCEEPKKKDLLLLIEALEYYGKSQKIYSQ